MSDILENRRHFRLKQIMDVDWHVDGNEDILGQGTVVNISQSGALLYTDKIFQPTDKFIVSFTPQQDQQLPFYVKKGKVVWLKKFFSPQPRYQFGVEFVENEKIDSIFVQWLKSKIENLGTTSNVNILNNYLVNQ